MKRISKRELIVKIKEETSNIKITDISQNIKSNICPTPARESINKTFNWKLKLVPVFSLSLIFIIGIIFLINGLKTPIINNSGDVSKSHQVYGLQAITLFNFVDNNSSINNLRKLRFQPLDNDFNEYQNIAEEINGYLLSAADILNKEQVEYLEEVSDNPKYQVKMSMKIKMFEHEKTYVLYFNETATTDYDDIDEVSSKIEGIIKTDNMEFIFDGSKELEKSEYEVELRMYKNHSKTEYYEVSQEIENRENEYSYSYYLNNKLVEEIEISIEEAKNTKVVELEVFQNGSELELEFRYYQDYILIEYSIDELEGIVKAIPGLNSTIYKFDEQEIEIFK